MTFYGKIENWNCTQNPSMVSCAWHEKWRKKTLFLLHNLNPKVNLANILDDYNVKQYSRSNGTTQVAIGYQQIDPKWPNPGPFSSHTFGRAVSKVLTSVFRTTPRWNRLALSYPKSGSNPLYVP